MAYTVWGAFKSFRETIVDLDPDQSDQARSSRDYLYDQLKLLNGSSGFPSLTGEFIPFGSFARKTKLRPLDDIDILVLLIGRGTTAIQYSNNPYTFWLRISVPDAPLARYPDQFRYVSSIKVLNSIKSFLADIHNYRKADIKRNQQAVTLGLASYDWAFDIVPAVPVSDGAGKTLYFLIPNGSGDWMRTDPTKDADNITRLNKQHSGEFLPLLRLLKYWNRRSHKPQLESYYFETLVMRVFDFAPQIDDIPSAIEYFFRNCPAYLWPSCPDPKGLGPPLDEDVDTDTKGKVRDALDLAAMYAGYALMYQRSGDEETAIYWWGRVFGSEFPSYG